MTGVHESRASDATVRETLERDGAGAFTTVLLAGGRVAWASDPLADALPGLPTDGTFSDRLAAVVDDEAAVREAVTGDAADGVLTVTGDDGERTYRYVAVPLDGRVADRLLALVEVTPTAARHERLGLFETLVERAQDGLYATDGDGRIGYCNESFADLLGADPATLRGRDAASLVVPADRDRRRRAVDGLADDDETDPVELAHRVDGDPVPLSVTFSSRRGGGVVAVARDVTERRRRERRLERYRAIVENAADPMWALDDRGRIELCNEAMVALLGSARESLVGTDFREVLSGQAGERIAEAVRAVCAPEDRPAVPASGDEATGGDRWREVSLSLPGPDGERRRFEATLGPVVERGDVVGSVGTFRDVTARERRRADLELLRRVFGTAIRTDVTAGVSGIRERADRLASLCSGRDADLAETLRDRIDALARSVAKSAAVDRLVETDPRPVAHDLAPLVEASVDAVRDVNPDATVSVDVPDVQVRAVPAVDLAVRNLVENALEHAGPAPEVCVSATVTGDAVELSVADDGPGVGPGELAVLERGAETSLEHGSGVGLWLVDWVVEKSGGDLDFETTDGTTVTVTLDRPDRPIGADPASVPAADVASGTAADSAAVDLLYVDDDPRAVAAVREAAADASTEVRVTAVDTVAAAVETLERASVDCVVTERLAGDAWSRLLGAVAAAGDPPVVCYTGHDHAALDEETLTTVDTLVEKGSGTTPARLLVEKVRSLVHRRDGETVETAAASPRQTDVAHPALVTLAVGGEVVARHGTLPGLPQDVEYPFPDDAPRGADGAVAARTVDGERRYYRRYRLPVGGGGDGGTDVDADVETGAVVEFVADVTATVERERRFRLFETLVDRAQDGISAVDADGHIEYHNPSFATLLGHEDMVGDHAAAYMAEGELEKGQLALQRLMDAPDVDSEVLDMDFLTADGERLTLGVHYTVRERDGEYAGLVNVARDVTERKRRERRLDQYRTVVESAGDPMFALDADGRIALVNAALERFLGRSRDALRGTPVVDLFPASAFDRGLDDVRSLVRGGDAETAAVWLRDADGDRHRYAVTVQDGRDAEDAAFDGTVWTCRDVTDRERRADELELLKQVLERVLRHNLRNELTLVKGHAELVADRTDGEASAVAGEIVRLSDELVTTATSARAVEDVLDHRDDVRAQSLADTVDAAHDGLDIQVSVADDLPAAPVEAHRSLPEAAEALVGTVARRTGCDALRVTGDRSGDRVTIRLSAEGGDADPAALAPLTDDPDALLDREHDVGCWLFAWVLDRSGGRVRVADDGPAVVVTLPRASDG